MEEATVATLSERTEQFEVELDKVRLQVEVQRQATYDAEKLANNYEALVRQKDDVIQFMHERLHNLSVLFAFYLFHVM